MRINDVEKITGLTAKAIRLYEGKGLITVARDGNGYRNYSDKNVEDLKTVRLLRSVGASLTDIKLLLFGVIDIGELMEKRKAEILKESGSNSERYRLCLDIAEKGCACIEGDTAFTEGEEGAADTGGAVCVGIDLGTTTVSGAVYCIASGRQAESYSLPHNSYVSTGDCREQSVTVILNKARKLLDHILNTYTEVSSIGITGQMHGIVYLNKEGSPVSNLINWQDKRGDKPLDTNKTACEEIYGITGEKIATGYGICTHYYNMRTGNVPKDATSICTVMDLFGMEICGNKRAVTHASVAASLGLFDTEKSEFMWDKLSLLGIRGSLLPRVVGDSAILGEYRGIPVSVPIGDNQASFLGSVRHNSDTMLVNIGTGSQVSAVSDYCRVSGDTEIRPFIAGKYLICGSALCGGFAYSMLEEFFRSYAVSIGAEDTYQYKIINRLASEAYERGEKGLSVDTSFLGKRSDPSVRGKIEGIDGENLTPSALALGVLKGMCNELYSLYSAFPVKKSKIISSGGAVRKNPLLTRLLSDRFGMEVSVSPLREEASTGAALFSALAAGRVTYENGVFQYAKDNKGEQYGRY